ncbi:TonB-dependent receptor plug domain-containing protein [Spongiimicrobium sp. 3-5]|uniref:TonB-dependent receptor n=1 Tax=Spongiimicrobium sp. 3-5 TaxID=3332596 RepID=UPI00398057F9
MPKAHPRHVVTLFLSLLFLIAVGKAQDGIPLSEGLISYIRTLEEKFDIKFSYVDEDIAPLRITVPREGSLDEILSAIQQQTQIQIKKLNERYYTLSKSTTVDICAMVLDNFEENTVTGATIEVLGSDIVTVTDLNGQFRLENIPRKTMIGIRHLGYKTKFVSAEDLTTGRPCKTLLLAQNFQKLDEVVLFKFLTTGLSKEDDASILLNTEDFGILPGLIEPDVLQTVQALPGIKSIDETVSDINIRGGTNDQNLILWDGIKMYQSGHFFGLISVFNPYLTDKVTIVKNGTSAQYGDGVSGVISMQTKNDLEDGFFGGAGFNLIGGDMYGQIPVTDNMALQFSARRSVTDFLNTPTFNRFFDRAFQDTEVKEGNSPSADIDILREENFYFYDFTGKLLYDINNWQKVRLSFINIVNNLDYMETAQVSGRTTESRLDQTNISFGGSLESNWTDDFSTFLNIYYTRYNLDALSISPDAVQQLFQNNRVLETAVKLKTDYTLTNTIKLFNGYQFNEVGITNFTDVTQPPFNSNIKGVIRTHALFSEIGYTSNNNLLKVRGGARLNYMENLDTFREFIIEPRLNVNYALTGNLKVEVLGEFKSQTTNQIIDLEQNFLGIEKRRWILSDEVTLPITKSKQGSMGFAHEKNNLYIGLEGFYKKVEGVSIATQGFQNQDQFNGEIGSYDIKGVEFLINKKTPRFSTWLSYAYNVNNYTFEDIDPSKFPNNLDIRHTLTFAGTYSRNNLKLGIGFNYRTGKPFTEPLDGPGAIDSSTFPLSINYKDPNSSRLSDYIRADASAIYDFELSPRVKASVGASVLNFLDRENILNTYYRVNNQDRIETVENVSLGITPNFSFRVWF